jgi:hypothetical protein
MEQKLSEIIMEMIEPYHKGNLKHAESLVSVAAAAWNMCIVPVEEGKKLLESILAIGKDDIEYKQVMKSLIANFIKTKLENYFEDNRFIASYKCEMVSNKLNLAIASVPFLNRKQKSLPNSLETGRNKFCSCCSGKKYKCANVHYD